MGFQASKTGGLLLALRHLHITQETHRQAQGPGSPACQQSSLPWSYFWHKPQSKISAKKPTIWLFNIAMENDPFIDDFPIKTSIYSGFSMAMLNNQRVPCIGEDLMIPF